MSKAVHRQAKTYALESYKRRMMQMKKYSEIKQSLLYQIKGKNPGLNPVLANNMKDYIILRMKQDSQLRKSTGMNIDVSKD